MPPALSPKGPVEPALQVSPSLADRKVPLRSQWYTEPVQAFDNLYYIGSTQDSTWAVKTSEGIIVVDTGNDYSIKELSDGLKKFKLDPAQIKYAVLSHAHGDRYWGAKFLQDTYHTRILMSAADWDVLTKSNEPNELKPKKDMIITDGQKLTLGDTTITMYLTPGHTPGTVSTIVPLKDGNDKHVGVIWGGMAPSFERYGVRYYSSLQETFSTWIASLKRFQEIAGNAHADVYLAIHPHYDRTIEKLHAIGFRKPGGPHPYVDKNIVDRFLTIMRGMHRSSIGQDQVVNELRALPVCCRRGHILRLRAIVHAPFMSKAGRRSIDPEDNINDSGTSLNRVAGLRRWPYSVTASQGFQTCNRPDAAQSEP